jgi:hypothetical protein
LTTTTGELKAQLATERGRAKERAAQLEAAAATVRETAQLKSQLTRERAISTELAKKQRKLEEQLEARPVSFAPFPVKRQGEKSIWVANASASDRRFCGQLLVGLSCGAQTQVVVGRIRKLHQGREE